MNNSDESEPISIDINGADFYNKVEEEIETDLAQMKKDVEVLQQLRLTFAENEVETAALYHAELFLQVEKFKILEKELAEKDSDKYLIKYG